MSQITWRNVDAPDFTGALTGVELANKLFNRALESGQSMVGQVQGMQTDAANRAIMARQLAIQDPEAYQRAVADGSIVGPDAAHASMDMLRNVDSRVGTLAEQAQRAEQARQTAWQNQRTRTGTAAEDAWAPFDAGYRQAIAQNDGSPAARAKIAEYEARPEFKAMYLKSQQNVAEGATEQGRAVFELNNTQAKQAEDQNVETVTAQLKKRFVTPELQAQEAKKLGLPDRVLQRVMTNLGMANFDANLMGGVGAPVGGNFTSGSAPELGITFGGGQLDPAIQTVGDLVRNKTNDQFRGKDGQLHTPVGIYQITAPTWEDVAPKVFGAGWENKNIRDVATQDAVAKYIFESAKGNGKILWDASANGGKGDGRWESLKDKTPAELDALAKLPWEEARKEIVKGEVGTQNLSVATMQYLGLGVAEAAGQQSAASPLASRYAALLENSTMDAFQAIKQAQDNDYLPKDLDGDQIAQIRDTITEYQSKGTADGVTRPANITLAMLLDSSRQKTGAGANWLPNLVDTELGNSLEIDDDKFNATAELERTGGLLKSAVALDQTNASKQAIDQAKQQFQEAQARLNAVLDLQARVGGHKEDVAFAQAAVDRMQARMNAVGVTEVSKPGNEPVRATTTPEPIATTAPAAKVAQQTPVTNNPVRVASPEQVRARVAQDAKRRSEEKLKKAAEEAAAKDRLARLREAARKEVERNRSKTPN